MRFDVHRVAVDSAGILEIDGVPSGRLSDINRQKYLNETAAIGPPNKARKCGKCGQNGHNMRTCFVEAKADDPELN